MNNSLSTAETVAEINRLGVYRLKISEQTTEWVRKSEVISVIRGISVEKPKELVVWENKELPIKDQGFIYLYEDLGK